MAILNFGRGATAILSLVFLSNIFQAQAAKESKCREDPKTYEERRYTVRRVRIDTPLSWLFGSVNDAVDGILSDAEMPIKAGQTFRKQPYDDGFIFVDKKFPQLQVNLGTRLITNAAYPGLSDCDDQTKQLDVVYRVYSLAFSSYLTRTFEAGRKEEISRGVPETKATRRLARFFVQPFVAYNRSRSLSGGTKFSAQVPTSFVKTMAIDVSGSSSNSEVRASAAGSREREKGPIRFIEWDFEYFRSDVPSNDVELKRGTGRGQLLAVTRPLGQGELVVRFGGAVEGGNRQTNLTPADVLPDDVARSGYKSLKAFVGGSMGWGPHAFKASYGAQFGNAGRSFKLDYVKQVVDAAADFRFVPWESHHPVTVQARLSAGTISTRGRLPVAERFIGGNTEQSFIAGSTWTIQGNPLIRSFPQNRFARTDATNIIGGDRFFSANLTLAATLWARPLVPKDILDYCAQPTDASDAAGGEDTDAAGGADDDVCLTLDDAVELGLSVAQSTIKSQYVSETPEFKAMTEQVEGLAEQLKILGDELNLAQQNHDPQVQAAMRRLYQPPPTPALLPTGTYAAVAQSVEKILSDSKEDKVNRADMRTLAVGRQNKPGSSRIEKMSSDLSSLVSHLPAPEAGRIDQLRVTFDQGGAAIKNKFNELTNSDIDKVAEGKARRDMIYPRRVVKELIHEANLYSVSPIAVFDVARLWQRTDKPGDLRYAAGGGVRFSLVSLDVTVGYAWNMHPRPWERRGALLFSMDLSNLFR